MKELLRRTATGIILVVLFAGSILLGPLPFLLMILVLYGLGMVELFRLFSKEGLKPCGMHAVSGAAVIVIIFAGLNGNANPLWLGIPAVLWMAGFFRQRSLFVASLVLFWLSLPLASFIALGWAVDGISFQPLIPLSVIGVVWINDIFAYLTGSLVGKHPMTPRLSPGKTWEGFAGGFFFSLLAGWIIYRTTGTFSTTAWIISGGVISVLAVLGDLFESGLKRRFNVKDSGNLLPGHGGILDRFDSLLFAPPAILLVVVILNQLK